MKMNAQVGVAGLFTSIEILDREGNVKRKHPGFVNLITDAGLAYMGNPNSSTQGNAYGYVKVSTDNTPPQVGDTILQGMLAAVASPTSMYGNEVEEGYCWRRVTWTFPLGAVVGNVAKLATGWSTANNTNFSIALIKDENGNPTTITLLEDEQFRVSWEHRRYWPTEDVTGSLVNSGNKGGVYNYTLRANRVGQWITGMSQSRVNIFGAPSSNANMNTSPLREWALYTGEVEMGTIYEGPSGGSGIAGAGTREAIDSVGFGVKSRARMPISSGNSETGITFMTFGSGSSSGSTDDITTMGFKVAFDPPIVKTNQDILDIEVQINWSRV